MIKKISILFLILFAVSLYSQCGENVWRKTNWKLNELNSNNNSISFSIYKPDPFSFDTTPVFFEKGTFSRTKLKEAIYKDSLVKNVTNFIGSLTLKTIYIKPKDSCNIWKFNPNDEVKHILDTRFGDFNAEGLLRAFLLNETTESLINYAVENKLDTILLDNLVQLKASKTKKSDIKTLKKLGFTPNEILYIRQRGIPTKQVEEYKSVFKDLSFSDIVNLNSRNVTKTQLVNLKKITNRYNLELKERDVRQHAEHMVNKHISSELKHFDKLGFKDLSNPTIIAQALVQNINQEDVLYYKNVVTNHFGEKITTKNQEYLHQITAFKKRKIRAEYVAQFIEHFGDYYNAFFLLKLYDLDVKKDYVFALNDIGVKSLWQIEDLAKNNVSVDFYRFLASKFKQDTKYLIRDAIWFSKENINQNDIEAMLQIVDLQNTWEVVFFHKNKEDLDHKYIRSMNKKHNKKHTVRELIELKRKNHKK